MSAATESPHARSAPARTVRALRRRLARSPRQVDLLVFAALEVLGAVSGAVLVAPEVVGRAAPAAAVVVVWAFALAAPLLLRRRFPCRVLAVTVVHFPLYWALGQRHEIASGLVLGVAVYSAAAYGGRPRAASSVGAALAASAALFAVSALLSGWAGS